MTSGRKTLNKNRHLLCARACVCVCAEHCYKLKQSQIHTHSHTHLTTLVCAVHPVSHVKYSSCISVISNVFPYAFICAFATLIFLSVAPQPTQQLQHIACNGALQFVVVVVIVVALRHCCCCAAVICDSNWVSSKFYCLFSTALALSFDVSLSLYPGSERESKLVAKLLPQVECIFHCLLLGGRWEMI